MKATDSDGFGDSEGTQTMSQLREITEALDRVRIVKRLQRRNESLEFTLYKMKFEILFGSGYDSFFVESVSIV